MGIPRMKSRGFFSRMKLSRRTAAMKIPMMTLQWRLSTISSILRDRDAVVTASLNVDASGPVVAVVIAKEMVTGFAPTTANVIRRCADSELIVICPPLRILMSNDPISLFESLKPPEAVFLGVFPFRND